MSTKRVSLLAVSALIVGVVIGAFLTAHFYQRRMDRFATDSAAASIGYTLSEIQDLRTGRTNDTLRLMEIELDGQILMLHQMLQRVPFDDRYKNQRSILESVRSYRAAHPEVGSIVFPK
jgi:hypothetical protein